MRRVEKRMYTVGVPSFADYMDYLEVHPEEFAELFNTILINVTGFFRDAAAWEYLANEVIPHIVQAKPAAEPIRVWSAGCASGEEAYTITMLLAEALGPERFQAKVKIYGTDADEDALNRARQATYTAKEVQDVPQEFVEKYFERAGDLYTFRKETRRAVIFGRHDLVQDAPVSRIDLLVCRNVLMYFNSDAQGRILARFHFALNEGGILFLGRAEMLLTHTNLFVPLDMKRRVFTKVSKVNLRDRLLIMAQAGQEEAVSTLVNHVRIRDAAFEGDPSGQLVIDNQGYLAMANQRGRQMFNLNIKDIGRPFQDLEISYRPVDLRLHIGQVTKERRPVTLKDIPFTMPEDPEQGTYVEIQIWPLLDLTGNMLGTKVTFADVGRTRALDEELQRSRQELETAYEELQSTNEELETTNEELQSTVEEMETTNEELQSTNEELETMNEELQSTNEELEAVNTELQERGDETVHVNAFLESVLRSLEASLVVVDKNMSILSWNHKSEEL